MQKPNLLARSKTVQRSEHMTKPKLLDRSSTLSKGDIESPPPPPSINPLSPQSKEDHMMQKSQGGMSVRGLANDFGTSKSTAHRTLQRGYSKMKDQIND